MASKSLLLLGVILACLLLVTKDVAAARNQFIEANEPEGKNTRVSAKIKDEKKSHGYYGGGYGGGYRGVYGGGYGGYVPGRGWYGGGYGYPGFGGGGGGGGGGRYGGGYGRGGGGGYAGGSGWH